MLAAPDSSAQVRQYSTNVAAGVDDACRATTLPTSSVRTLEGLISSHTGTPCAYSAASSFWRWHPLQQRLAKRMVRQRRRCCSRASNSARLNSIGTQALLTQLGIDVADPEVPMTLTAASYQGSWDIRDATRTDVNGVNVLITPSGASVCKSRVNGAAIPCALTFTNLSTGAFNLTEGANAGASSSLDFLASTGSGADHAPSAAGSMEGNFVAQRC